MESPRPLTAVEIYTSVDEYRDRYEPEGDKSSLEKMFERDREALALTGIEIGTVPNPSAPGDRAQWRYEVKQNPASGASFDLTAEEILLINEATAAWLDPELHSGARQTFVKMLGEGESGGTRAASVPRTVVSTHPLFGALRNAVANKSRIAFSYHKLGGTGIERRDIDALALFSHRGRWLMHGFDHERQAPRNFLLKRILSDVTVRGTHTREPVRISTLTARLDEIAHEQPVTVLVKAQSEAEASLTSREQTMGEKQQLADAPVPGGWRELVIHDWDLGVLADELAGFGTMVRVIEPAEVMAAVQGRLERMIASHADPAVDGTVEETSAP